MRLRTALLAIVALLVVGTISAGVIHFFRNANPSAPTSVSTPDPVPGPTLEGTYRFVYDDTKRTKNGAAIGGPNTDNITWWAFRSICNPTECVATATGLDANNPQVSRTPAVARVMRFADGRWQSTPERMQTDKPKCLGVDGKVVPGAETQLVEWSLEPQSDGSLRGVAIDTTLTNECGFQGNVIQTPLVATRTGEVPTGVTVADPAAVPAAPSTPTPAPPAPGPVLDGMYRIDYDFENQTVNGQPATGDVPNRDEWWAFRSTCTPTSCVASGTQLIESNQQQATGVVSILRFVDGSWQDTPYLQASWPCSTESEAEDTFTISLNLQPQSDGTLRGFQTGTIVTDGCGRQGNVYKTPIVATRKGDVPSGVIIADPALFE